MPGWHLKCTWTIWFDDDFGKVKSQNAPAEEVELLADAQHFTDFPEGCSQPRDIQCRTVDTHELWNETADAATCDVNTGLRCVNIPGTPICADYEVTYLCCTLERVTCSTPSPPETTTAEGISVHCLKLKFTAFI